MKFIKLIAILLFSVTSCGPTKPYIYRPLYKIGEVVVLYNERYVVVDNTTELYTIERINCYTYKCDLQVSERELRKPKN